MKRGISTAVTHVAVVFPHPRPSSSVRTELWCPLSRGNKPWNCLFLIRGFTMCLVPGKAGVRPEAGSSILAWNTSPVNGDPGAS